MMTKAQLRIRTWIEPEHTSDQNILIGAGVRETDKDLFFGPLTATTRFVWLPDTVRWPQALKQIGVFQSTSDACRNGWNRDIEEGYQEVIIGKRRTKIAVLKITKERTDDTLDE